MCTSEHKDKETSVTVLHGIDLTKTFAEKNPHVVQKMANHLFVYSLVGLIVGVFCIIFGTVLVFNGFVGNTSWTAKLIDFESKINDTSPGVVFSVIGALIIYITKFKFTVKK